MRRCNAAGKAIIKEFEGLRLEAYLCPAGKWTIGYGHTGGVKPGDRITADQAQALLDMDLDRFERDVDGLVTVSVTSNQFSALVSFAYNVGSDIDDDLMAEGLGDSTLLVKLNAGDPAGAAAEFGKWVRSAGIVLPGLVKRRQAEADLFLTPDDVEV